MEEATGKVTNSAAVFPGRALALRMCSGSPPSGHRPGVIARYLHVSIP